MERKARRAAWLVAAMLTVAGAVGVAQRLHVAGTVAPGEGGATRDAPPPVETLHAEPRPAGATAAHRRERRLASPHDAGGSAEIPLAGTPPPTRPVPATSRTLVVANVRPAAGAVEAGLVVARDWTPAKSALAPSPGLLPDTSVARAPSARRSESPEAPADETQPALVTTHGLRGDYFDFLDGQIFAIPDVTALPPTFSRIDLAIDFDNDESFALPFEPETFAVRWTGSIRAPEDGTYRFTCGSDDGARVSIDGKPVIDQPRLRAYAESTGDVNLAAGLHPIEIVFYENQVYASCRLWWDGPGWKRRIVGTEFLFPPGDLANVVRPVIGGIDPPEAFAEDTVTVRGVGFVTSADAMRVTFNGVPAEIVAAGASSVQVKVPLGAATGDVVVRVGEISSLPQNFEVRNLLGLYAEYYKLSGEILDYPDFAHLAPYFVRLDANLDFMSDNLWDLPYDSDVFAARHTGFLYVPEDDDYRVTLGSDDGARVTLDGKTYLEIPGLHPYAETSQTTHLAKGFHQIEVIFFENYGEARLALFWQRPSDVTRSVIPAGFFYAPRELTDLPVPVVAATAPEAAEIGGEIEIRGSGFGVDARLVRVVFPGEVWARPAAVDDGRIRVRVPYGVAPGDLHVEVGVQSSNRVRFRLATPQGLVADYMVFTDRAAIDAATADLSILSRPANVTRVETSWQRAGLKEWALPFDMPSFVVHWHGTIAVEYPSDIDWILRAAAGARLDIDGGRVVDCGPWHELEERYGRSHLAPGEHRFDLWLAQSGAEPRIQLLYTPVGRIEHLPVPATWFLPREPQTGR